MITKTSIKVWDFSILIIRVITGVIFLFSGFSKLTDIESFKWSLIEFKIFGSTLANLLSIVIIIAEITLALLILFGLFKKFASIHLAIMIIAFGGITIFAMAHNKLEDCNCLGKWINLSYGPWHLILLSVLFIMVALIFFDRRGFFSVDSYFRNRSSRQIQINMKKN